MSTLRYALRSLARSPGFVLIAVLSLGLGLGLTTTMFAVMDAIIHPYNPFPESDRVFRLMWWLDTRNPRITAAETFRVVVSETHSFEAIVPGQFQVRGLDAGPRSGTVFEGVVPARLFGVLGITPERGRLLIAGDENSGAVLVSHEMWRRLYPGRDSIAGATIRLNSEIRPIVGVLPRGMNVPIISQVWSLMPAAAESAGAGLDNITPTVKLKAGVTREAAQAELTALAHSLTSRYDTRLRPFAMDLLSLAPGRDQLRAIQFAQAGAAIAVLLIACANLANLMLARGLARRREIALRMALGAGRATVIRQMFTECALIVAAGAAAGLAFKAWAANILANRVPREVAWLGIIEPQTSWRVFAMAAVAIAGAAIVFGLIPAIRVTSGISLDEPLKDGGTSTARTRNRYSGLVVAEVALTMVLVMASVLLVRVSRQAASIEHNFAAQSLSKADIWMARRNGEPPIDMAPIQQSILAAARAVPGVQDVATETDVSPRGLAIMAEGEGDVRRLLHRRTYLVVSPSYLRTKGLPVLEGRDFEDGDWAGGAAILSASDAATLYPDGNAVGRMIQLGGPGFNARWVRVVGVAQDIITRTSTDQFVSGDVYVMTPLTQQRSVTVIARTPGMNARRDERLTQVIRGVDPRITGGYVQPYLAEWQGQVRAGMFMARLFAGMASFALCLSAIGIYGVLAYAVTQRMREFAIRKAIGARDLSLLRLVLHDGLVMVLAGTALGAVGSLVLGPLLGGALDEIPDPVTLIVTELIVVGATLAACITPALRAMRSNPLDILRAN